MKVHLSPGEVIFVTFDDAEVQLNDDPRDGIRIEYYSIGDGNNRLDVTAIYEDDKGRVNEIYSATFDGDDNRVCGSDSDSNEVVETITCNSCGESFEFTKGEQRFMQNVFKDNYRVPVRCRSCRKTRSSRNQNQISQNQDQTSVEKGDEK
ncbi:zinc-ribbon domain-containing protein [Candidatus Bathyarchaeota archaeon]|nr:zinc-ribbon domain-containing protein [Candidatus Bathyarchaeota archaeon]